MNLLPFAIAWAVLGVIVLSLALMRRSVTANEDDSIHLGATTGAIDQQVTTAKKLEAIDKWGKMLTVVLAVSGLALVILYGMQVWEATSKAGLG
jgi:anaerobic C4-dicarboxylate transporter